MTDPKPNYRLVNGEPCCGHWDCYYYRVNPPSQMYRYPTSRCQWMGHDYPRDCSIYCIPGLRLQRDRYKAENDALQMAGGMRDGYYREENERLRKERDDARRRICEMLFDFSGWKKKPERFATENKWNCYDNQPESLDPEICVDCVAENADNKGEIVDECGSFDSPDGVVCRSHHEKRNQ